MRTACSALVLGLMLAGVARVSAVPTPFAVQKMCDAPDVEEASFAALDYINHIHRHGYKYALNRIEEVKVVPRPAGGEVYILELDLLQTTCHVLDPTPLANCTVRSKIQTTVEGDCDVAVSKVDGVLAVQAFKCKSKPESLEDVCLGCPTFLPLNHTAGLQVVHHALDSLNQSPNSTAAFALLEVARLTSQVVTGGPKLDAEFLLVETNCTGNATVGCGPVEGPETHLAVCHASSVGLVPALSVNCKVFHAPAAPVTPETNATLPLPPVLPAPPLVPVLPHGHMHDRLIHLHLHDPSAIGLLSESNESGEVPVAPAVPIVKREAPVESDAEREARLGRMGPGIQLCPGAIRFFKS